MTIKGIFITSSGFSSGAIEYAKSSSKRVVLIDGERLAKLMVEYNLGLALASTYEVKRVDGDYFEEE